MCRILFSVLTFMFNVFVAMRFQREIIETMSVVPYRGNFKPIYTDKISQRVTLDGYLMSIS